MPLKILTREESTRRAADLRRGPIRIRDMKTFVAFLTVLSLALPAAADAQKGVLGTGTDPTRGIADPGSGERYTAVAAGTGTTVLKLAPDGARVKWTYLPRQLVVPSVAYDGSPGGLSGDGDTLVLAEPGVRFPQERSEFTVLDTERLRVTDRLSFPGTWTFDALSPDGRTLYMVEYTSPRDISEYLVRSYDLRRGELEPRPILDPDESAEEMYGTPVNRVTDADGRWAYTLYDAAEHPFIHALDTERGRAVCIDLDDLRRPVYGLTELELSPGGDSLAVVDGARTRALVDLGTFEVSDPPPEPAAAPASDEPADDEATFPWALALIAAGGALLIVAVSLLAIRRRFDGFDEDGLERLVELDRDEGSEREREPVG
jgi:hypothetical protein